MKHLRIKEAVAFHNARRRLLNKSVDEPENKGFINLTYIAVKIWNGMGRDTARSNMSWLISGKKVSVRPYWILILCALCEVDPNFLFGEPSKYDEQFNQLMNGTASKAS